MDYLRARPQAKLPMEYQSITNVVGFYMTKSEFRQRLLYLNNHYTRGQALRSDGPFGQIHRALHWIGWSWETGECRPFFRMHNGAQLEWSKDRDELRHKVRDAIRHKALAMLSYRRPSFTGVDAGVCRKRSLPLHDALNDWRQSQAMLRYHHCGAIYWGTAAATAQLPPAVECTLCGAR